MTVDQPTPSHVDIAALMARINRPIVLVGLMGVGKSSVGRRLATLLDLPFTDADDAIEEAAQMTISDIFAKHGEQDFRDGERRVIGRLMENRHGVIATGGGAFVNEETRALILDKGIAVWLDADLDTLVERVGRKNTRPLLQGGNPRDILAKLKTEREPAYAQAPIHVISAPGPHQRTINAVLKALDSWL